MDAVNWICRLIYGKCSIDAFWLNRLHIINAIHDWFRSQANGDDGVAKDEEAAKDVENDGEDKGSENDADDQAVAEENDETNDGDGDENGNGKTDADGDVEANDGKGDDEGDGDNGENDGDGNTENDQEHLQLTVNDADKLDTSNVDNEDSLNLTLGEDEAIIFQDEVSNSFYFVFMMIGIWPIFIHFIHSFQETDDKVKENNSK